MPAGNHLPQMKKWLDSKKWNSQMTPNPTQKCFFVNSLDILNVTIRPYKCICDLNSLDIVTCKFVIFLDTILKYVFLSTGKTYHSGSLCSSTYPAGGLIYEALFTSPIGLRWMLQKFGIITCLSINDHWRPLIKSIFGIKSD